MAFSSATFSPRQFQGIVSVIFGSATVNPGDTAAGAEDTVSVTVPGAAVGDAVIAFPGINMDALQWVAQVTAANTVEINSANMTADHINIGSSTWRFLLLRPKGSFAGI